MNKFIIKSAKRIVLAAGVTVITAEVFGSFGKGLMLGHLMKIDDPYAIRAHKELSELEVRSLRGRLDRWLITDVATWESKQKRA